MVELQVVVDKLVEVAFPLAEGSTEDSGKEAAWEKARTALRRSPSYLLNSSNSNSTTSKTSSNSNNDSNNNHNKRTVTAHT